MKYYHIHYDQDIYCGCYEDEYIATELPLEDVEIMAENQCYDMLYDYIWDAEGDDEDSDSWSQTMWTEVTEITKEEYEENK